MIRINHPEDREAIAKAAAVSFNTYDPVIARVKEDTLYGGFMFTNFTGKGGSIWAHVAAFRPGWLSKHILMASFEYPFLQLNCRAVFTRIGENNIKSLDFCTNLGFNKIHHLHDVYPDGSGQFVFKMKRDECRWLTNHVSVTGSVH